MTVKIEDMFGNAAYEFVDLIKADPLVSEASFEVKKEVPEVPTQGPEVPKDMTFKTSELTKRMGKNANKIKNNPNHPINRVQKPNIRREERLVDTILGELEEATPRPKATQRGKISKAEAQKRQAREDRKRAAQERRDDRAKAGIDALIGSDADRKAAAAARANPEGQRKKALKRTLADRMARGAEKHGLEEGDFWHPDPEQDRKLGGPGANQRAREDRAAASQPKSDPKKLRPGESYMQYSKRMKGMKEEIKVDENRFASHGGRDTDAGSAYAKPSKGGSMKGVYILKGKDGKPLFDKREKSNEETEIDEKFNTQYKDKKKLGQSSERKSLGRGSSIKDGSKKTGYESPKEFRDASMSLRKHRERFGDLATEGKYSSSVRATYGGKTETFPVEVYKKKGKEKKQVSEGDLKDRARRAVQNQRDGYHGDDDALTKEMDKTKKSVDKLKNSNVVTRYSADAAAKKLEKSIKKEEVTIDERVRLEADNGNLLMVVAAWKGKSYQLTMFFPQPSMPTREEVESEIQKVYPGSRLMSYRITRRGEGQPIMQVVNSHSKNYLLNNGNIGEEVEITEDKREEKARRAELAKKHGIDLTKPGSRAKLSRLMKADTISKKRKDAGDVRTDKEVRKDNAINRKEIDKERQHLKQSKTKKGTEARRRVDKKMDDFRRELRSSDKPAEAPPTREKVKVKVGTKVDKPADAPKTGRNKPTAEKRADRKSYEAQQRRNAKEQQNEDWQKVNKGDKTDGMSKKAVAAYRRENPGSKLKTAVTGKVKKGSKDAKRRKSFCARSKGQQDMHNIDCSKTPDKPVCKARRRWKC